MKVIKFIWKVLQSAILVLLSLILLSNLWILGAKHLLHMENPTVFGVTWAVVLTGSMEPEISGNDMVVTKVHDDYAPGDIIMFQSGDMLVTHRIVDETENGFITRGDANNTNDSQPVLPAQIVGKVILTIPAVGLVVGYLGTPLGMLCVVVLGFMLIQIPYLLEERKAESEEGNE